MIAGNEMGIDYIANKVLDAFVDLGLSEIKEALIETDRRKILRDSCESFIKLQGTLEYQTMRFENDNYNLSKLSEGDLDPNNSTKDLCETITPYVKSSLVSDKEISWEHIIKSIAEYYKKRALATAGFKEIAIKLDSMSESSNQGFENIQTMLVEAKRKEEENEYRKRRVFERYIQIKVNDLITTLTNDTYYLVFKKGFTINGNEKSVTDCLKYMNEMVEKNDDDRLKAPDYWKKPVMLMLGPNERLEPIYKSVLPSQFINQYIIDVESKISEILRYESVLPESVYYAVMELEMSIKTDINMKYVNQMALVMPKLNCREDDINNMLIGWCKRALNMGQYYEPI